jgi:hypothetical protein
MEGPTRALVVNVNQNTFGVPFGWKISRQTDDIVSLMLGRGDLCIDDKSLDASFDVLRRQYQYSCRTQELARTHSKRCDIEEIAQPVVWIFGSE